MATKVELKQAREALKCDFLENQANIPVTRFFSLLIERCEKSRVEKSHILGISVQWC